MLLNPTPPLDPHRFVAVLRHSRLSIYDPVPVGHPALWIPAPELEALLDERLRGLVLAGLALRTRSKVVKESVCRALGYPVPRSFCKNQPRFPGQHLSIWVQPLSSPFYVFRRLEMA